MRLSYSQKGDPRGRHLVLTTSFEEQHDAKRLVENYVLVRPNGTRINARAEKDPETGGSIFRFNEQWLDRIMLVFPECELSKGIQTVLARAEMKRLKKLPVPDYKFKGFKGKFWGKFQKQGAHQIVLGNISFLNDEMGLGKTFQVLAAICRLIVMSGKGEDYRAVIVVPNNTKYSWAEVLLDWFDISYCVLDNRIHSFAQRQRLIEHGTQQVTIINLEGIRARAIHENGNASKPIIGWSFSNPALFVEECHGETDFYLKDIHKPHGKFVNGKRRKWDFFVLDEHHRVKTPYAQVTNGFFNLMARRYLFMSGTPILNRPTEIWTCLHKLWPDVFNSFEAFAKALAVEDPGGKPNVNGYNPAAMAELRSFLQEVSLRRRKDQVRSDLPKVVDVVEKIELSPEQRELYRQIKEDFLLRLEDGTVKTIAGMLPQITRLKQAAFSPELYGGSKKSAKVEKLREIVQALVENGEKAIVFSQWSKATRIIQRELADFNPAYVTGEEPNMLKRQAEIRRFREDPKCKLYIGTIGANREGVNLGAATYVIFTDLDWVPAGKDQARDRSAAGGLRGMHLAGTDAKVHVIEIQAEDTIEEWIQQLLEGKRQVFDRMVERDAGRRVVKMDVKNVAAMLRAEGTSKMKKTMARAA